MKLIPPLGTGGVLHPQPSAKSYKTIRGGPLAIEQPLDSSEQLIPCKCWNMGISGKSRGKLQDPDETSGLVF